MTLDLINPSISNNDYWNNPSNWAKPVNGGFNPNSQNIQAQAGGAATTPTAMSQSNDNSNSNGSNAQSGGQNSPLQNPTTGNTGNPLGATANSLMASNNQALLNPAGNPQAQQPQQTGLNPSTFASAIGSGARGVVNSLMGTTGSISNAINAFGASNFGTSFGGAAGTGNLANETISSQLAAADSSLANPTASASALANAGTGSSASLTGILGGAGFGIGIGSLLAGVTGGNQTGGMIGGGIGGALGAASGITSGITMGATLGSIVPGLGTVIGAVAGSLIGGMFGNNSPPTNADAFGGSFGDVSAGSIGHTSKNAGPTAGFAQNEASAFVNLVSSAGSSLGFTPKSDLGIGGGISTKHPGSGDGGTSGTAHIYDWDMSKGTNISNYYFNPSDNTSVSNAYYNTLVDVAKQSGYTDTQALYNWFYGQGPISGSGSNHLAGNNVMIAPRV